MSVLSPLHVYYSPPGATLPYAVVLPKGYWIENGMICTGGSPSRLCTVTRRFLKGEWVKRKFNVAETMFGKD